jgi:hypothetical protein
MTASEALRCVFDESGCLGVQPQMGGKFHLKLNIGTRPIANKYREGKMKSTLKRELKVCETVEREAIEVRCERIRISRGHCSAVHLFCVLVSISLWCRWCVRKVAFGYYSLAHVRCCGLRMQCDLATWRA